MRRMAADKCRENGQEDQQQRQDAGNGQCHNFEDAFYRYFSYERFHKLLFPKERVIDTNIGIQKVLHS